ncbi:hypothetical protein [Ehrlichia japonica]|uniref:Uncharacterized protein n=1 Tax=Ehrlichia japonica TaxID=391036 RepID=X5GIZ3_9RICK|nr:hypothetical protein [Ehrlichia japonica]AHX04413.1 hypothetical protein EHF_0768 [Ehrlichia japonica]
MPFEIIRYTSLESILKKILNISEIPQLDFHQYKSSKNESLYRFVNKNIKPILSNQHYYNYKNATKEYPQIQIINTECIINLLLLNCIQKKLHNVLDVKEIFELLIIGIIETKCSKLYNNHIHSIHHINIKNRDASTYLKNVVFLELYAEPIWKKHIRAFTEYFNRQHNLRILILKNRASDSSLKSSKQYSNTDFMLAGNHLTANHIECLFLENYQISIISHFPNLKFLQIKIKPDTFLQEEIQLSKYFHPHYKRLEHIVLANTMIGNNKATYFSYYNHNKYPSSITFSLTDINVQNISTIEHNIVVHSSRNLTNQLPNNINLAYQFLYNMDEKILYPFNKSTQTLKGNNVYNINITIKERNNTATSPAESLTQNIDLIHNQQSAQNLGNEYILKINDNPSVSGTQLRTPIIRSGKRKLNTDDYNPIAQTINYQDSIRTTNDTSFSTTQPILHRILSNVTTTEITGVQCHK